MNYVENSHKNDFYEDRRTQQAVMMNLMVIGEIATKLITLFPDFIAAHPEIPWSSIKACAIVSLMVILILTSM